MVRRMAFQGVYRSSGVPAKAAPFRHPPALGCCDDDGGAYPYL